MQVVNVVIAVTDPHPAGVVRVQQAASPNCAQISQAESEPVRSHVRNSVSSSSPEPSPGRFASAYISQTDENEESIYRKNMNPI